MVTWVKPGFGKSKIGRAYLTYKSVAKNENIASLSNRNAILSNWFLFPGRQSQTHLCLHVPVILRHKTTISYVQSAYCRQRNQHLLFDLI